MRDEARQRPRDRSRKVISLLFLAVGWMAVVATSQSNTDTLTATMGFTNRTLEAGSTTLVLAVNEAAMTFDAAPDRPLTVTVSAATEDPLGGRDEPIASLRFPDGAELPMLRVAQQAAFGYEASWAPDDPCSGGCLRRVYLIVDEISALPRDTRWEMTAEITYESGANSVPEGAGLILGIGRDDDPELVTSETARHWPPGIMLTSDRPSAQQSMQVTVPEDAIGIEGATDPSSTQLIWEGGLFQVVGADQRTEGTVHLAASGGASIDVPVSGSSGSARFSLPLTFACAAGTCSADMEASFQLSEGGWLVLDWSNSVEGLQTQDGDGGVLGWRLRSSKGRPRTSGSRSAR